MPLVITALTSETNFSKNKLALCGFSAPQYISITKGFVFFIFAILHCIGQM